MDLNGFNPLGGFAPVLRAARQLLAGDYALISPTPNGFGQLARAVRAMQAREPHYAAHDLAEIEGPAIAIADGAHEEFIRRAHTDYLARTIPGAELVILPDVGHFAPLQAPDAFNASMLGFLDR
jgi:pimeloyl-ACP methyl ester carboxylesterase